MPSPACFNVDQMLEPCKEGGPAGPDLRLDTAPSAIYQQIRSARERSRDVEIQVQKQTEGYSLEQCQWGTVFDLGVKAVRERSKDYQILAWVCEAGVRTKGFAGLRDALRAARRLGKDYWGGIYPKPEQEEGVEPPSPIEFIQTRVQPWEGLFGGALNGPLSQVPLTEVDGYTFLDYRLAKELEKIVDKAARQLKIDAGAVAMIDFEAAFTASNPDFYKLLHEDVTDCLKEVELFGKFLDEKCGKDEKGFAIAPSTSDVQKTLETALETIKELGKRKGLFGEAVASADGQAPGAVQVAGGPAGPGQQNGRREFSRDDALAQLLVLADFFRKTEPHSPVSHHVEEAVRWGRMPLAELLGELIADDKVRAAVLQRVGITDIPEKKK